MADKNTSGAGHYERIGVYLGSSYNPLNPIDQHTAEQAKILGRGLAMRRSKLVYGGGSRGLMGILSRTVLESGGEIEGYLLPHFDQDAHEDAEYIQKPFDQVAPDINARKQIMYDRSDAFVIMPGGFGTMEELWDVIGKEYLKTYEKTNRPAHKPIILVNIDGHYDPTLAQIERMIETGKASPEARKMIKVVTSAEEALSALDEYERSGPVVISEPIGNVGGFKGAEILEASAS